MGVVCLIEQDAQIKSVIESTLKEIDGQLEILSFSDLGDFYKWFSSIINKSSSSDVEEVNSKDSGTKNTPNKSRSDQNLKSIDLKLLIGDIQFLGPNYFSLIEKLRKLMVRRKLLKNESDLAIILTAFDSPELNFKQIESQIITNVFFKPFDLPILKQQLKVALGKLKSVNDNSVFSQKLETSAEMLKEVQLESFTDLGFVTRSNRELKINDVSKYYSSHFEVHQKSSLLARCLSCHPHPNFPGEFQAEFQYLGVTNHQIRKLRQELFSNRVNGNNDDPIKKQVIPRAIKDEKMNENFSNHFLIFLRSSTDPSLELKEAIERNISNASVTVNRNMKLFLENMERGDYSVLGTKPIHGLFLTAEYFVNSQDVSFWEEILEKVFQFNLKLNPKFSKPKLILTSHIELSEARLRQLSPIVSDIIYTPIDRPYLYKRIVTLFKGLQPKQETIEVMSVETCEIIRVANPIAITSISEANITMKYYRPISLNSFRRFCLPSTHNEETLELLGSCFKSEKQDGSYLNHFVFFGITDRYLKYIRKWILEKYVSEKEKKAS